MPVIAASTPGDCFWVALEAVRIAVKYMTPVIVLSDGYLANGAEPWRIPDVDELPKFPVTFRTDPEGFLPYARDPKTLARPWAMPGTPGLEHRIGGLEKEDVTGNVSYEPLNHEQMVRMRAEKIDAHRAGHPGRSCPRAIPTATCWSSAGARPTAPSRPRCAPRVTRAPHRPRAPAPPEPAAREPGRRPEALQARARARDEPGPAAVGAARQVPGRRARAQQGPGPAVHAGTRSKPRSRKCWRRSDDRDACRSTRRRTSSPTRTCAGAPAAGTTRSSRPCRRSSPSSASRARTSCSSRASAARAASRTT